MMSLFMSNGIARLGQVVVLLLCAAAAQASDFWHIPAVPNSTQMVANAISNDGHTIVGDTDAVTGASWTWSVDGGLHILSLPSGYSQAAPEGVSSDGTVLSGIVMNSGKTYDFRWPLQTGLAPIDADTYSTNAHLSSDGNVVYGTHQLPGSRSPTWYRWTAQGGRMDISNPTLSQEMFIGGANADGSLLVGSQPLSQFHSSGENGYYTTSYIPMVWTLTAGLSRLTNQGQNFYAGLTDCSADGSVIIGTEYDENGIAQSAFMWTQQSGVSLVPLGLYADVVSGDGKTIAAIDKIWTQADGVRTLEQLLTPAQLAGWSNLHIVGVSYDGLVLTGLGDFQGHQQSWVAAIPAPGAAGLFAFGGVGALRRRRRSIRN